MAAPIRLVALGNSESNLLARSVRLFRAKSFYNPLRNISDTKLSWKCSGFRKKLITAGTVSLTGLTLATIVDKRTWWPTVHALSPVKPQIIPSRSVFLDSPNSELKLTLFQFQTCPFCCKTRAMLDYYGFSYDIVEVNSVTKKQIKWSTYRKVPIVIVDGIGENGFLQLNDSSVIISMLYSWQLDRKQSLEKLKDCYGVIESEENGKKISEVPNKYFIMYFKDKNLSTPENEREERKWRRWADDHLVHMLSPNVYRTPSEALQAFHYFSDVGEWEKNFSTIERWIVIYTGAMVMYFLGKMLQRKHNLKEDVRESLYDACRQWVKAIGSERMFMGGDHPNLADLSVYGVLHSIEGCQAWNEAKQNTKIGIWYQNMQREVQSHAGACQFSGDSTALTYHAL